MERLGNQFTNGYPILPPNDRSILRRFRMINCCSNFVEDLDQDDPKKNIFKKDIQLIGNVKTRANLGLAFFRLCLIAP